MNQHHSLQCSQRATKSSMSFTNQPYKASFQSSPSVRKGRSEVATTKTPRVQAARHGHVRSIASLAKASGAAVTQNNSKISNSTAASDTPAPQTSGVQENSSNTPLDTNDSLVVPTTPETAPNDTDNIKNTPCVNPSQEGQDAGLRASMQAIHQPDMSSSKTVLTPSPLVCLPNMYTPFLQHPLQLGYFIPTPTTTEPTPEELAPIAKLCSSVAQHEEPQSKLQRTPQLCLRRLGGGNTHVSDKSYFQTTVQYQRETRLYGRSSWQTVEYSLRFDIPSEASTACTPNKLAKAPLETQLSDDLAPQKTDTTWVQEEDATEDVSGAVDLYSKAVSYVSRFTQLWRRVSSSCRWSSSSA